MKTLLSLLFCLLFLLSCDKSKDKQTELFVKSLKEDCAYYKKKNIQDLNKIKGNWHGEEFNRQYPFYYLAKNCSQLTNEFILKSNTILEKNNDESNELTSSFKKFALSFNYKVDSIIQLSFGAFLFQDTTDIRIVFTNNKEEFGSNDSLYALYLQRKAYLELDRLLDFCMPEKVKLGCNFGPPITHYDLVIQPTKDSTIIHVKNFLLPAYSEIADSLCITELYDMKSYRADKNKKIEFNSIDLKKGFIIKTKALPKDEYVLVGKFRYYAPTGERNKHEFYIPFEIPDLNKN